MVELARAPTGRRPPNYPYPVNQGDRTVYGDDEVELDGDVESGGEVSSESDDDHTQACLGVQVLDRWPRRLAIEVLLQWVLLHRCIRHGLLGRSVRKVPGSCSAWSFFL